MTFKKAETKDKTKAARGMSFVIYVMFSLLVLLTIYFASNTEQEELDTAVDEGGPSREFISEVCLQMETLQVPVVASKIVDKAADANNASNERQEAVPVAKKIVDQADEKSKASNKRPAAVKLFQVAPASEKRGCTREIFLVTDEYLKTKVESIAAKYSPGRVTLEFRELVEDTLKRARLYSRAIGSIIVRTSAYDITIYNSSMH